MRLSEKLDQLESQVRLMEYIVSNLKEATDLYQQWMASSDRYQAMTKAGIKGIELKEMGYIMDGYMRAYKFKADHLASDMVRVQQSGFNLLGLLEQSVEALNIVYSVEQQHIMELGDIQY